MNDTDTTALRRARERAKKTQREVAAALGVAERTYVRWEHGVISPGSRNAQKLLAYFPKLRLADLVLLEVVR